MSQMKGISIGLLALCALLLLPAQALGAAKPVWQLSVTALPTNFAPGSEGTNFGPLYLAVATNVGSAPSSGQVTFTDTLPEGIVPTKIPSAHDSGLGFHEASCAIGGQEVICTHTNPIPPGHHLEILIAVKVDPLTSGETVNQASIEGGGALPVVATTTTTVDSSILPFDFLPGFSAPLSEADGSASTEAGSHPYQLSVAMGFPTARPAKEVLVASGHLRDTFADLPRGEIVDPAATPVLCTEVALISGGKESCPLSSQVGTVTVTTIGVGPESDTSPLYNMVPPPGVASSFGFDALGVGVFPHIIGSVRSDGDYGLTGGSTDLDALFVHPIFGIRVELWGDPTDSVHDGVRGECAFARQLECPAGEDSEIALLTTPTQCSGEPTTTVGRADSWEQPGAFKEASYQSADLEGNPVTLGGCGALEFKPTIEAKPTTTVADSPSGLDFTLHQPQDLRLEHASTAALEEATVTLPPGMVVNPSQADGLGACSTRQIGLRSKVGQSPIHFDENPNQCPDSSKLGTLEVKTPLLAETDEAGTKVQRDAEGNPIPRPLQGSVYLAKPFDNPYGSLVAIYLAIEDARSGTIAKLAGKVEPNPGTGQLTTRFEENPELPLEDVQLHLFKGARAALITPLTCATHTVASALVPWSTPEGASAHPQSSFQITAAPGGGNCPASEGAAPNNPSFEAGTIAPQAGAFSPFVLKLSREDGSQRLAGIDTTLPPGLSGKLAGIAQCSEAQIAQAKSREHPNEGVLEQQSPSCPSSSEVGTVDVAAGAGPTPIHTQGHAYLAPIHQ